MLGKKNNRELNPGSREARPDREKTRPKEGTRGRETERDGGGRGSDRGLEREEAYKSRRLAGFAG